MNQQCCRLFGQVSKYGPFSVLKFISSDLSCTYICQVRPFNQLVLPKKTIFAHRCFSTSVSESKTSLTEKAKLEKEKKKKLEPPKVVLISETNAISIVTLEEAGKIAKRKGLNLIETENTAEEGLKTDKQVYKLVSNAQFYGEDWKSLKGADSKVKETKEKEEKTVLLKSKTSEHDVLIKVKNIKKWVEKGHVVKVFIGQSGVQGQNPEIVYKIIEDQLKDAPIRIVQKVNKSSQIRFQVMPPKKEKLPNADEKKAKKLPPKINNKVVEENDSDSKSSSA